MRAGRRGEGLKPQVTGTESPPDPRGFEPRCTFCQKASCCAAQTLMCSAGKRLTLGVTMRPRCCCRRPLKNSSSQLFCVCTQGLELLPYSEAPHTSLRAIRDRLKTSFQVPFVFLFFFVFIQEAKVGSLQTTPGSNWVWHIIPIISKHQPIYSSKLTTMSSFPVLPCPNRRIVNLWVNWANRANLPKRLWWNNERSNKWES